MSDAPRLTVNWWTSEVASGFLAGSFFGATWGAFNPWPLPGTLERTKCLEKRKLVPLPPFSSLASVGRYAGLFGTALAIDRMAVGALAVARNRQDGWDEAFGKLAVAAWVYKLYDGTIAMKETRIRWNNRAMAGIVLGSVVYANTAPKAS
ncbi:hypothetical protein ACHAXT_005502 [Thalassiosira profunda]